MDEAPKVMRCSECEELFAFQMAAYFQEKKESGPMSNILLCPVCRLLAVQRGIEQPPR